MEARKTQEPFGHRSPYKIPTQMLLEEVKTKNVNEEFIKYEIGHVCEKECLKCEGETSHKLEARATVWQDGETDKGTVERRWHCLGCRETRNDAKGIRAGPTARLRRKAARSHDE